MKNTIPGEVCGLRRFRVRVVRTDGQVATWDRFGSDMETALDSAKKAAAEEFVQFRSIAICGEQGNSGVWAF